MEKQKVKVVKIKNNQNMVRRNEPTIRNNSEDFFTFGISLIINALVLMLASSIFKGFEVASFGYALIGALIISALTQFIKPFLVVITIPLTIVTFGLFYPFINVIILKLTGLLLGSSFQIKGILIPLLVSFFISFMNWLLEQLVLGNKK